MKIFPSPASPSGGGAVTFVCNNFPQAICLLFPSNSSVFTSSPSVLHQTLQFYIKPFSFTSSPSVLHQTLQFYIKLFSFTSSPSVLHQTLQFHIKLFSFTSNPSVSHQTLQILLHNYLLSYQGNCSAPERGGGGGEDCRFKSSE